MEIYLVNPSLIGTINKLQILQILVDLEDKEWKMEAKGYHTKMIQPKELRRKRHRDQTNTS
jgi:hypothetical protein